MIGNSHNFDEENFFIAWSNLKFETDPHQGEKSDTDPDPHRNIKSNLDPDQQHIKKRGLDLIHVMLILNIGSKHTLN